MPTDTEIQVLVRDAIFEHGAKRVAKALGLSPEPVLGLALGSHVHEGTRLVARANVHRLAELRPRSAA